MSRQRRAAPPPPAANAPPPIPAEVTNGLEAIRRYGNRDDELYIRAEGAFFEAAFMTESVITGEEMSRFIKKVETLVRTSREYKIWVSHLRNGIGLTRCSFLAGLDYTTDEIGLEMHHAPLTLYEIVEIIASHRFARGQAITSMTLADEVIQAHMRGVIGVVPLSKSVHKLVHAGAILIHPAQVHGHWIDFMRDYADGVHEDVVAKIARFLQLTEEMVGEAAQKLAGVRPLLRDDAIVPALTEVRLLASAPR